MSMLFLSWRSLCRRPLQNILVTFVMSLSLALAVLLILLGNGIRQGIITAVEPFPLVAGVKGSPNQLLLNTVFLKDLPMDNLDYRYVEKLRANPNVESAIPLAYGDNYRGRRIVGTEAELFKYSFRGKESSPWLRLREGKIFSQRGEVVLGAQVAQQCGLAIGDRITSAHGVVAHKGAKSHEDQFTVVGILEPVNGPYDNAVFISLKDIWEEHSHNKLLRRSCTAVLIRPTGYVQSMRLCAEYSGTGELQMLLPAKQVIELFNLTGGIENLLKGIGCVVVVLALCIVMSTLYWTIRASSREQAVMRALGAGTRTVMRLNFYSGLLMVAAGTFFGSLLGHACYAAMRSLLRERAAIVMGSGFVKEEVLLVAAALIGGSLCCLLPVWLARKRDIIRDLQQ